MFGTLKTTALSALIGLATLAGVSAAGAEGITLGFGNGSDVRVGVYVADDGMRQSGRTERGHERDRRDRDGDRNGWDRNGWDPDGDRNGWGRGNRRECTPERALEKAERLGLRRARIVDVDRRTIEVAGRSYGERVYLTFARAPHCPIIR